MEQKKNEDDNQIFRNMLKEQRAYLDQHREALSRGLNETDLKKLEQILIGPNHSVLSGMKQLVTTFDSFANQNEQSGLLEYMPFFLGSNQEYSFKVKVKVLGRLVQEFIDKAMSYLRSNIKTRLWVLAENLDKELYEVVADLFLSDLVNKVAIQVQAKLIEAGNFEALERCGEESGKAPLRRGLFLIHEILPKEYGEMFEMTVFLAAYFSHIKDDITKLVEKFGFRSTMEILVVYAVQIYRLIPKDVEYLKHRFINFCQITQQRVTLIEGVRSDLAFELIWQRRAQKDLVQQLIFFFCRNPEVDIVGLINKILVQTQKSKIPAITEQIRKLCREANFDGLSRELANYLQLSHST